MRLPSLPLSTAAARAPPAVEPILPRIEFAGQASSGAPEPGLPASVETFVARVRGLSDDDRVAIANARRLVDETFHERALAAGYEALAGRSDEYLRARRALADVHIPDALAGLGDDSPGSEERAYWHDVARLVLLAIDDALLAILPNDSLHPNHMRELYRSLKVSESEDRPSRR